MRGYTCTTRGYVITASGRIGRLGHAGLEGWVMLLFWKLDETLNELLIINIIPRSQLNLVE